MKIKFGRFLHLHNLKFVKSLPVGLDTFIGERGIRLSVVNVNASA